MSTIHNSVETINAAATAIVTAQSRVQPTAVQKRRWGSCWSLYWCFGSYKHSKRIGHAVLIPEPTLPGAAAPAGENLNHSTTIVLPFIAPPSSPASFLQSDPPSATQSPAGLLSLASLSVNAYSPGGPASTFAIGPYAHETQLVSPPVFSTFTTEPSTASFTPPPEPVQLTTPSSPEVPFAQLLTSSLARTRRNSGTNQKITLSQYEFQPYQLYPGSPFGHLISPGSAISNSGTSTPFPDKRPIIEFRIGDAPKLLGYEHFYAHKWGSRLGSGSLTPNGGEPASRDSFLLESQISEVASRANSENGSQNDETVIDHRVSFELCGEDVPTCVEKYPVSSLEIVSESLQDMAAEGSSERDGISRKTENCCECCVEEALNKMYGKASGEGEGEQCHRKHRSITLGSIKEFNFDNTKREVSDKPPIPIGSEWWANEKVVGNELGPQNNWTFFPVLQPGVS
uniref:Hydroxyproline-rich glycoprotein family protein n=1 Tax=Davidia involucrata TaxID=16924 RepID=A0A5B7AGT7_DAVIN